LRLEYLFKQFQRNQLASNQDSHLHALHILFEILEILERGDTRSELIKELSRLLNYFQTLEANPEVDTSKLSHFLKQVKQLHQWAHHYPGKFGDPIRKNPFIMSVRQRSTIPGGSCQLDSPDLYLFINKPYDTRQAALNNWLSDIKGVETSIDVILRLIRESGQWVEKTAPMGSFMLETTQFQFKLLRIKPVEQLDIFPDFSCGKHRSNIHFMRYNNYHKKIPLTTSVKFNLSCCS